MIRHTVPLLVWLVCLGCGVAQDSTGAVAELRKWSDTSGGFSVSATFVNIEKGNVSLRKEDGSVVTVPLAKLSKSDQEYVRTETQKKPKGCRRYCTERTRDCASDAEKFWQETEERRVGDC